MTSSNMAGGDASHGDASAESLSLTHADRLRFAGFDFRKLPSGLGSASRLPVSVSLIGPPGSEWDLLEWGSTLQAELGMIAP